MVLRQRLRTRFTQLSHLDIPPAGEANPRMTNRSESYAPIPPLRFLFHRTILSPDTSAQYVAFVHMCFTVLPM